MASAGSVRIRALESFTVCGHLSAAGTIEVDAPAVRFARGSVLSLDLETGRANQPLLKALRKAASIDFAEGSGITILSHADNPPGGLGDKVVLAHADSGKISLDKDLPVARPNWLGPPAVEGGDLVSRVGKP